MVAPFGPNETVPVGNGVIVASRKSAPITGSAGPVAGDTLDVTASDSVAAASRVMDPAPKVTFPATAMLAWAKGTPTKPPPGTKTAPSSDSSNHSVPR